MSLGIQIEIRGLGAGLPEMAGAMVSRDAIAAVASRGVANRVRENFDHLERTRPNKKGFPRTHLWSQFRRATQNPTAIGGGWLAVAVNHVAVAQRLFGGPIRPVNADFLTLPATAEAHGKRAREFNNLEFGIAPDPELGGALRPALIEAQSQAVSFGRRKKDGTRTVKPGELRGGRVYYWLARMVNQRPDPAVLPTEAELVKAAEMPARDFMMRQQQRGGAGNGGGN